MLLRQSRKEKMMLLNGERAALFASSRRLTFEVATEHKAAD